MIVPGPPSMQTHTAGTGCFPNTEISEGMFTCCHPRSFSYNTRAMFDCASSFPACTEASSFARSAASPRSSPTVPSSTRMKCECSLLSLTLFMSIGFALKNCFSYSPKFSTGWVSVWARSVESGFRSHKAWRPSTSPHGTIPMTGAFQSHSFFACPISFDTPVSSPLVNIHALVSFARFTKPVSSALRSSILKSQSSELPVTEISSLGRFSPQTRSQKKRSKSGVSPKSRSAPWVAVFFWQMLSGTRTKSAGSSFLSQDMRPKAISALSGGGEMYSWKSSPFDMIGGGRTSRPTAKPGGT
mmetsp:Transcript_37212/g.88146  ORF Transcript_37212/g.88146 Transcript_37212/m.88146 type:complete len:300 (-) Transcript_37212:422-1321(-)